MTYPALTPAQLLAVVLEMELNHLPEVYIRDFIASVEVKR